MGLKFGRKPRRFSPAFPHYSALKYMLAAPLPSPPSSVDWTGKLPDDLGQMLNNQLGCCVKSAWYHAIQLWSSVARGAEVTEPDAKVELLYELAAGYNPTDPATDQGSDMQTTLTWLLNNGTPTSPAARTPDRLVAFVEVDPANQEDVQRTIDDCGLAYIGFNVPQWFADQLDSGTLPNVWDVDPAGDQTIVGGHCVILPGYQTDGSYGVISWGSKDYGMTPAFFAAFVDEAYGPVNDAWLEATGKTPLGLSLATLEAQMRAIKA